MPPYRRRQHAAYSTMREIAREATVRVRRAECRVESGECRDPEARVLMAVRT